MSKQINWRYKIGEVIKDDKRDLMIIDRKIKIRFKKDGSKCNDKCYKYKCNVCGFECGEHWNTREKAYMEELWIVENNLKNRGCSCCSNYIVVKDINSIFCMDKWMIPIINDDEFCKTHTHGSNDYIYPICIDCGNKKSKKMTINKIYSRKSISCPKCGDGFKYPNKFMFNILQQLNEEFKTEYSPDWIKPKAYDFYIFELNCIIEMDGGWHTKDNKMSGQSSKQSKTIDNYKDKVASKYGIEVIRIDCDYPNIETRFEYIRNNILNNVELNKLFNFSKINWIKCQEYLLSNLVKIASDYKRNNVNLTTGDIGKIMNLDIQVVRKYLKQGTELSLCNYNADEEQIKNGIKNGKLANKLVEILKDGVSLGTFESAYELERQSEKLFGVILYQGCISNVCTGKSKSHK